jgi:hypothetical protein
MMCPVLSHLPCRNLDIPVLSQNLNPDILMMQPAQN